MPYFYAIMICIKFIYLFGRVCLEVQNAHTDSGNLATGEEIAARTRISIEPTR